MQGRLMLHRVSWFGWNSWLAAISIMVASLGIGKAQAQDAAVLHDRPLAIGVDEIRLEGKIIGIDVEQKSLTIEASAFVLPNGKSGHIAVAKPKTVKLGTKVLLYVRGTSDVPLAIGGLQLGLHVLAVGRDAGTGQPLTARAVAVWKTERDGKFYLGNVPEKAVVAQPSTPESLPKANMPIVAPPAAPVPLQNEIHNGDFETLQNNVKPEGWLGGLGSSIVEDDKGNHFVLLKAEGDGEARKLTQEILLAPNWKSLKVTARVRGEALQMGKNPWEVARINITYFNAKKQALEYSSPIKITTDCDWIVTSGGSGIPANAHYAVIAAVNSGYGGAFSVDEIVVEPNGALDVPTLATGFPQGTFELLDPDGTPQGWLLNGAQGVEVGEENGNHFLRMTNAIKSNVIGVEAFWKLDPATRIVRIRARVRGRDISPGKQNFENARLGYSFADAGGARVGDWPPALELRADSDWRKLASAVRVPPGAILLRLAPQLLNATGTFDVDDIQIEQIK
jgi:hypothetical protein